MNTNLRPLSPFQDFCVKFLGYVPSSYDECMTYLECLIYTYNYLKNEIVPTVNTQNTVIQEMKDYIDNYFTNLDVQEEINNKLDDMVEQGTLQEIIAEYIQLKGVLAYNSVAEMKSATNLINGSFARTYGYYSVNDGGGCLYKISDTLDPSEYQETLDNGLYATLVTSNYVTFEMFGAKGDGVTNDTTAIGKAINYKKDIKGINGKTYYLNSLSLNVDYINIENANFLTNSVAPSSAEIIDNVSKRMFQFQNDGEFTFNNCKFTTYANQDETTSWLSQYTTTPTSNVNFLHFLDGVKKLNINNCDFTNGVFDIWVSFDGTEELKGVTNITNCTSTNACIFYDSRWVLENNIDKCYITQSNKATTDSHCIYLTYGEGMKANITNCDVASSTTGGTPIDIYHGNGYDVYMNNCDITVNNTSCQYLLLLCGLGSHGIIENCRFKSTTSTSLLYQGTNLNENNNIIFDNCYFETGYLNRNVSGSNLYATFKECGLNISGCYYNAQLSGNNQLIFERCNIVTNGVISFKNMKFIDCYIETTVSATNTIPIFFRNKGEFIKNYVVRKGDTVPNKVVTETSGAGGFMVNNILDGFKTSSGYNIEEINTTYIHTV